MNINILITELSTTSKSLPRFSVESAEDPGRNYSRTEDNPRMVSGGKSGNEEGRM